MRGFVAAALLVLALPSVAFDARATEPGPRAQPAPSKTPTEAQSFRLLELEGRKVRWAIPANGLPATVSYAFVSAPMQFPGARNCDAMTAPEAALRPSRIASDAFRREVEAAFDAWEGAANIVFTETDKVADAGILIGADAKPRGRAFTNVALRDSSPPQHGTASIGAISQSLICLNPRRPWKIGFDGNLDVYDVRFTIMHEVGHAIGLDHPSPEGQLMSFRYVEAARDLQPGDVAGAAALYGRKGSLVAPVRPRDAANAPTSGTARDHAFGLGEWNKADDAP